MAGPFRRINISAFFGPWQKYNSTVDLWNYLSVRDRLHEFDDHPEKSVEFLSLLHFHISFKDLETGHFYIVPIIYEQSVADSSQMPHLHLIDTNQIWFAPTMEEYLLELVA